MGFIETASLILSVTAIFAWFNHHFIKLPTTIGIMLIALVFSLLLVVLNLFGIGIGQQYAETVISGIDFNATLMQGMLSFLLFAGALHVNLSSLVKKKWIVGILATVGVTTSTFIVGFASYYLLNLLGFEISLIYCLVFGSLISPTDPVAVMGVMKTAGASESLGVKIAGESLFNDGIAVVIFLVLVGIAASGHSVDAGEIGLLLAEEALGGAVFGLAIGFIAFQMLKSMDNYQVEVLITLALVMGGYTLASKLHLSGPIAIVVAGLIIGNQGRSHAMSDKTREHLDTFWELIDEILNAVLFVLIGLEVIILTITSKIVLAGLIMAVVVLLARFVSVGIPVTLLKLKQQFHPHIIKILTWGGLRGGISVALALSLPAGEARDIIVPITYIIVIISITTQGLTIGKLIKKASSSKA